MCQTMAYGRTAITANTTTTTTTTTTTPSATTVQHTDAVFADAIPTTADAKPSSAERASTINANPGTATAPYAVSVLLLVHPICHKQLIATSLFHLWVGALMLSFVL